MVNIKIRFGGQLFQTQVAPGTTTSTITSNRNIQGALGFGSNVQVKIDGVVQSRDVVVREGDELYIESVAASKA
jgi:hypothetical protein